MFALYRTARRLRRHLATAALCAATVATAQPARADSFSNFGRNLDSLLSRAMEMMPSGVRNVRFGLGPAYDSHFQGDNSYYVHLAPVVSLRYRNLVQVDNNSVRINFLGHWGSVTGDDSPWSAGPAIKIDFGRSESDSTKLTGLGDIGTSVEPGAFVGYNWGPFRARVRVRKDIADATDGLIVDTDLNFGLIATDKLFVNANLYGVWGNKKYNNAYFGVTPMQSAASGLPVYDAHAGIREISATVTTEYLINDRWSTLATLSFSRLVGSAANGPLVKLRGSPNQPSAAIFAIYSF